MKQLDYALVAFIVVLIVCAGVYNIEKYVVDVGARMCVEPSALPWLWCSR